LIETKQGAFMKLLILFLTGLSALPAFASYKSTYLCTPLNRNMRPYDTFIIELTEGKAARMNYIRRAFAASEENAVVQPVPGCDPATYVDRKASGLYLECRGDGDAGFVDLKFSGFGRNLKATGEVNFPEGNLDYDMDTKIPVQCYELD
jgi:hypothetical protein